MAKKKHSEQVSESVSDPSGDFESALAEVEEVVELLEGGQLGLTESLAQYERGIEKIKLCHQVLRRAEQRIAILTAVDQDGTAVTEPVDLGKGSAGAAEKFSARLTEGMPRKGPKKARGPICDVDGEGGLF